MLDFNKISVIIAILNLCIMSGYIYFFFKKVGIYLYHRYFNKSPFDIALMDEDGVVRNYHLVPKSKDDIVTQMNEQRKQMDSQNV